MLTYRRAIAQDGRHREEKDTKTHQQRRVTLDPETVAVLTEHWARCQERAASAGMTLTRDAFVFSRLPGGRTHLVPSSVTQRYGRSVRRLDIDTHLHNLRRYSATELIAAGAPPRSTPRKRAHRDGTPEAGLSAAAPTPAAPPHASSTGTSRSRPPAYQSVTPRSACSASRRSASAHTATNSSSGTRRLRSGMRSTSSFVTSMHPESHDLPTISTSEQVQGASRAYGAHRRAQPHGQRVARGD
ncbi:MAG: site-specific integrase [Pseudonocardia sp.]|nr:site-specific integrase [Pseudonocardia sp.]